MADVTLAQSGSNNGTTTPATPGSLTLTAGNLAVLVVFVVGTSPTVGTPTNWTLLSKTEQATRALGMFARPNQPGGATNPSSALGGTVTGWVAAMLEFTATGANCGIQSSAVSYNDSPVTLPNVLSSQIGQTIPNLLFVYSVGCSGATTLTGSVSGLAGLNSGETWSSSVQTQTNVQGLNLQTFWGSNLAKGPGSWPICGGTVAGGFFSYQVAGWFNTLASHPSIGSPIGGNAGLYVPPFFQGMVGG